MLATQVVLKINSDISEMYFYNLTEGQNRLRNTGNRWALQQAMLV